ncbi:expressed unknown protein [Seminavis robusta]|uniref:very-long-chain (3R)-3-hydroxyacyl-CoA dehydratase n=1 Tax=Seminavis robusta TaxID=568900 RepID=A0A9N8EAJ7_9STRA|nr:expressed unknown protein [Seminavis robusta]|eukprot:Sro865_g212850.1 n/a (246) ;mRNA; f:26079-26816
MTTTTSSNRKKSPLAPLAPAFSGLNWVAFGGWLYVLVSLMASLLVSSDTQQETLSKVRMPTIALEGICVIEVLRIALGDVPGNITLGSILHTIRITAIVQVLPRAAAIQETNNSSWHAVTAVLFSWAVTEVSRYPMYMFPTNNLARSIRMVVPLVTFPIGAVAEFAGAYTVMVSDTDVPLWLQFLLVVMMLVNGALGPYLAYPHLLKKGLPVLGLATTPGDKKKTQSTTAGSKTTKGNKPNIKSC